MARVDFSQSPLPTNPGTKSTEQISSPASHFSREPSLSSSSSPAGLRKVLGLAAGRRTPAAAAGLRKALLIHDAPFALSQPFFGGQSRKF